MKITSGKVLVQRLFPHLVEFFGTVVCAAHDHLIWVFEIEFMVDICWETIDVGNVIREAVYEAGLHYGIFYHHYVPL